MYIRFLKHQNVLGIFVPDEMGKADTWFGQCTLEMTLPD